MKKRIVVLIMMALAVFMCVQQPYWRDEKVIFQYQCGDGAKSVNFSKNNYTEWAEVPSSYMYYENGKHKVIYSADIKKLEQKVKAKGLEWIKLSDMEN